MSAVTGAHGGDGWSSWSVSREGNNFRILVSSRAVQARQPNPAGWGPKTLHDELMRDDIGRRAIDRAISLSAEYAHRMSQ